MIFSQGCWAGPLSGWLGWLQSTFASSTTLWTTIIM